MDATNAKMKNGGELSDHEVTRMALRISMSAWSKLEVESESLSEEELLKKYILLCPYVSRNSKAVHAALGGLERGPPSEVPRLCEDVSEHSSQEDKQEEEKERSLDTADATTAKMKNGGELSDHEVTRMALRISMSAWSKLEVESESLSEEELLKKYILLCPYVSRNSKAVHAALGGLERGLPSEVPRLCEDVSEHSSQEDKQEEEKERSLDTASGKSTKIRQRGKGVRALGYFFRTLFCDFPLAMLFFTYLAFVWLHRVHDLYLTKQLQAMVWDEDRSEDEITYYDRYCYPEDLSTTDPHELFLPKDATPEEAMHHQLKHGFSVFQSALSREAAADLREYVISKNRNLTEQETIYVIANDNRYSFGLDTGMPAVARAMEELSNHDQLNKAMEKIMGPDAALIEMTAITAAYGAGAQYWHDDVVSSASPLKFARTFGPSYSFFVQLQDTTKEMGATSACPGSHYCATGPMDKWCEAHGFQIVTDEGYWSTGDAMLMNMDSWHRGAAHIDPKGLDRVMLILTFVPKPQERAESRQMAQGITFSLRWDHWGMTWRDLKEGRFWLPWVRALSIFKPSHVPWGLDYISSSSMRIANEDNGFRPHDLEDFLERDGGFWYLPKFMQAEVGTDESWPEFLNNTVLKSESFMEYINAIAIGVYVALSFLCNLPSSPHKGVGRAVRRVVISHGLLFVGYLLMNYYVDNTFWAKDILANRRYSNAFVAEESEYPLDAPMAFPTRTDVLVQTRYDSEFLHMYNDWMDNHPGNELFNGHLNAITPVYRSYPDSFREASVDYIVEAVKSSPGRFLHQSTHGTWLRMSDDDVTDYVKTELHVRSSSTLPQLRRAIKFIMSDYKYGIYRGTSLSKTASLPYLRKLQTKLMGMSSSNDDSFKVRPGKVTESPTLQLGRSFKMTQPKTNAQRTRYTLNIVHERPQLYDACAWCQSGDEIEVKMREDDGRIYWYMGKLTYVGANDSFHIKFFDGEEDDAELSMIRPYIPYQVGDRIDVIVDQYFVGATIVAEHDDGHFAVQSLADGNLIGDVHPGALRRAA